VSAQPAAGVDELLDRLEKEIAKLADGGADLDQLVAAYDEARKLAAAAEVELEKLKARLTPG
jgi:exodeoxyribonuclease VII small subunit